VYVADRDFSSNFLCNDYSASDGNIDYNRHRDNHINQGDNHDHNRG
jgi:hypothetical protein